MDINTTSLSNARAQTAEFLSETERSLSRRAALGLFGGGLAAMTIAAVGKSAGAAFAAPPYVSNVESWHYESGTGKAEFRFPKDATVQPGQHVFRDLDDLLGYLADAFPSITEGSALRGTIKRVGKYRRVDHLSRPVFTFGDPLLDLITDERGVVVLDGKTIDLRAEHVAALPTAATGPQSTLWFPNSSTRPRMRFRAFKNNYWLYWKIGAEIETWGHDFTTAKISSQYGASSAEVGHLCGVVKVDSDSDSNDDYVDEYEWGAGLRISSDVAGVLSRCTARWRGRNYTGVVGTGCSRGWA